MSNNKEAAAPPETTALVMHGGEMVLSARTVKDQVQLIQQVMEAVMEDGTHYGKIEGCGDKPTLLKPGAEKLCLTFRLDPQYESTERYDGDHLTVKSRCALYHINTGQRLGSGEGSCSTKESKYAYRQASRKCPKCGAAAIIKGKEEYGGGWLCFGKKGGCGAKFANEAPAITTQVAGRVPNEDLPDQYNTILKMANKRSLIAAVLNVTAASDIFTQDLEDMTFSREEVPRPAKESNGAGTPPAKDQPTAIHSDKVPERDDEPSPMDQVRPKDLDLILDALKETCAGWTNEEKKKMRSKLNQHVKDAFQSASLNQLMIGDVPEVVSWIKFQTKS